MKFEILSDLHTEFYNSYELFIEKTNLFKDIKLDIVLILAGDIGNPFSNIYKELLLDLSNKYDKVLIISGNHEYYNNSILDTDNKIDEICDEIINVFYLNNRILVLDNIKIIGSTLWSDINNINPFLKYKIKNFINDFKLIKDFVLDINNYSQLYNKNKLYIENEIINTNQMHLIVITHHGPTFKANKYGKSDINNAFYSNLDYLFDKKIDYWIFGHSHIYNKLKINNTNIICNPIGYPNENTNYIKNLIIEI